MINPTFEAYKKMALIRIAEEELAQLYLDKKIFSMVHFYVGQEAVAVGVCQALLPEDKVLGNHRSHGHYLARGGDLTRMVAELLGRESGLAGGKGGSMHMIDKSVNFIGSTPLLGSVAPIATGVAFAEKYKGNDSVTVAFYGDGASEEGVVYESYNLAALFKAPVLFIVENNTFSINSKLRDRRPEQYDLEKIVTGFGGRYLRANGNSYADVFAKASELVQDVRTFSRPAVLECVTYRHMAHSTPLMEENYRGEDTLEKRLQVDSFKNIKDQLFAENFTEETLTATENEIRAMVKKSIETALNSNYPPKESMFKDIYA